jgi:hypothetical protein
MKKTIIFFLSALLIVGMVINSCKKQDPQTSIASLFTNGSWQLSSVMRLNIVGGNTTTDTLNTNCDTTQIFTFTKNTCSYTNFHCIDQPTSTGNWSLSTNGLVLYSNIACKDTLPKDSCCTIAHPFIYTQIVSIGLYQMTLKTGDVGSYYGPTTKRTVYMYSFIRVRN